MRSRFSGWPPRTTTLPRSITPGGRLATASLNSKFPPIRSSPDARWETFRCAGRKLAGGFRGVVSRGGYSGEVEEALKQSYHEGETFGSAFGKLFARTLAGRGLILLNPIQPNSIFCRSVLRFAAEHAEESRADLMRRDKELTLAGYHAQVRVTSETTLLFRK